MFFDLLCIVGNHSLFKARNNNSQPCKTTGKMIESGHEMKTFSALGMKSYSITQKDCDITGLTSIPYCLF